MSRVIKDMVEQALRERYGTAENILVISVHGLSGVAANEFRGQLHKHNIEAHVVKNSAARRVLAGTPLAPLGDRLTGPCAFVTGGVSPADTAKELLRLAKEYPAVELKFGILDGESDVLTIEQISTRRSKAELQGEVVMLFLSPARRIAGCLNVGGKIAGCIKAIVDKLEKGEEIKHVA